VPTLGSQVFSWRTYWTTNHRDTIYVAPLL
jgi:hypothetical protein